MSSAPESEQVINVAEQSLVATLREQQTVLARLGYANAHRMLTTGDRFVEDLSKAAGRLLFISGDAIQDLGPEHQNQIEVSISVISDDAHIGAYVYFAPEASPEVGARIFRRPLDPSTSYNVCELTVPKDTHGGPPSNTSLERTREG
jgi:hypothetical protein